MFIVPIKGPLAFSLLLNIHGTGEIIYDSLESYHLSCANSIAMKHYVVLLQ